MNLSPMLEKKLPVFGLFFILAFLTYAPILHFSFFQDDYVWLSFARDIPDNGMLLFTRKISNFFMPTVYGYFTVAYFFFHTQPVGYYIANIVLHTINATLLFFLLARMRLPRHAALVGSLFFLFLRYPMEAVVWISAVTVLLTTFFILLTGHCWITFLNTQQKKWYGLTVLCILLTLMTKEWSILLVPFLLVVSLTHAQKWKGIRQSIPLLCGITLFIFFQWHIQTESSPLLRNGYYEFGWHFFPNIVDNVLLLFVPLTNQAHASWWLIASVIFVAIQSGMAAVLWKRSLPWYGLGFLWLVIAYVPTSFFTWGPFVSRYAYLPAIGGALMVAHLFTVATSHHMKRILVPLFTGMAGLYLLTNIFFIHRTLRTFYLPEHQENTAFIAALSQKQNMGTLTAPIALYDTTPVKGFLLPDVLHALFGMPREAVSILQSETPCPQATTCMQWQPLNKTLEQL